MAVAHAQAEALLKTIGIPHVVLRMPFVYGVGDRLGLFPRILCAAVYRRLGEKVRRCWLSSALASNVESIQYRILWTGSLKMHTLHVIDACRACWHAANRLPSNPSGAVFNVVDQGDTDQGKFNRILSSIFKIETDFYGTITSNLAKLNFAGVCEMANEKHTEPWTQM
jgi:nucleoside-diphosphate-sugar epimerase